MVSLLRFRATTKQVARSLVLIVVSVAPSLTVTVPAGAATDGAREARIALITQGCAFPSFCYSVKVVNPDGTGDVRLANYPASDYATVLGPVWSPDGAYVAWSYNGNMVVARSDGSVSYSFGNGLPTWSPDSTQLAFAGPNGIVISSPDGSNQRTLPVMGGGLEWSPDGSRIAYVPPQSSPTAPEIDAIRPDGTGQKTLVSSASLAAAAATEPSGGCGAVQFATSGPWSPDGRLIAINTGTQSVSSDQESETSCSQVAVADATTGKATMMPTQGNGPAWAPDGSALAYTGGGGIEIYRADGSLTAIGATSIVGAPSWSPDAGQITYRSLGTSSNTGQANVVNADGTGTHTVPGATGAVADSFSPSPLSARYLGVLRTDTAVDVARNTWTTAPAVIIARDDTYPDALAAGPVAATLGGPLLLTDPNNLPASVCSEITALGAHAAYVMGDTTAVSAGVQSQLGACGITSTTRLQGPTRFDTAAAGAAFVGGKTVYITEGADPDPTKGWPDAVSVSALAAHQLQPILLVTQNTLPAPTRSALQNMGVSAVTIIGGTASVSDQVAAEISAMGITVSRIAGADRYSTSADVATAAAQSGLSPSRVWLAIGNNWPDALAAGPAAAHDGGVLLLVDGITLANSAASQTWLSDQGSAIVAMRLVGGPDVLSPTDAVQAVRLADG
jgi:putative cell wall-binding protein